MINIPKTQMELIILTAKDLLEYVDNYEARWTEHINLRIDKIITHINFLFELYHDYPFNENPYKAIEPLRCLLIDLEQYKNRKNAIGKAIGYKYATKDENFYYEIKGINTHMEYHSTYKPNKMLDVDYLSTYKNKLTKDDVLSLVNNILLQIGIDEDTIKEINRSNFNIKGKKDYSKTLIKEAKYKAIIVNDIFLSLPLSDIKKEVDYQVFLYCDNKQVMGRNGKTKIHIRDVENYESFKFQFIIDEVTSSSYYWTPLLQNYYKLLR